MKGTGAASTKSAVVSVTGFSAVSEESCDSDSVGDSDCEIG